MNNRDFLQCSIVQSRAVTTCERLVDQLSLKPIVTDSSNAFTLFPSISEYQNELYILENQTNCWELI